MQATSEDVKFFEEMTKSLAGTSDLDNDYKKTFIWILYKAPGCERGRMVIPLKGFKDKKVWDKTRTKKLAVKILNNIKVDSIIVDHDDNHKEYNDFIATMYARIDGKDIVKEEG